VSGARLTFNHPMNPATVGTAQVSLTGPGGGVALTSVAAVPGTNGQQFDVTFPPQGPAGSYALAVSGGADVYGNPLAGPYAGGFSLSGLVVLCSDPAGQVNPPLDHVRVVFNHALDPAAFTTSLVTLTGPGGPVPVTGVVPVTASGNIAFDVTFAAQGRAGGYALVVSAAAHDPFGNALGAPYTAAFSLSGPTVLYSDPGGGDTLDPPLDHVRLYFDRAMDPATLTTSVVTLTGPGGAVALTGVVAVPDSGGTDFDATFAALGRAGDYTVLVGAGARDTYGNPLGTPYTAAFSLTGLSLLASDPYDGATVDTPLDRVALYFNHPMDPATFTPSLVTVTGPGGPVTVTGVVPEAGTNNTVMDATFATQGRAGSYTVVVSASAPDAYGNPLGTPYTATFSLTGLQVLFSSPAGLVDPPLASVRVVFNHGLDPAAVTAGLVTVTGPGGPVAVTGVAPVAASDNTAFDFTFAPLGAAGDYTVVVSAAAHDPYGNTLGGPYTGQISVTALEVADCTATGVVGTGLDRLDVTFDRPLDPASFTAAQAHLTAPDGSAVALTGVAAVPGSGNTRFEITFAPLTATGGYQFALGAGIRDTFGNALTAFASTFTAQALFYTAAAAAFQSLELSGQAGVQALTFTSGSQFADDDFGEVLLGAGNTFTFYGQTYDRLYVSSNGLITFGSGDRSYLHTDLSVGGGPAEPVIAALWGDWIKSDDGTGPMILYKIENNRLVIEWNQIQHYYSSPQAITFQAVLSLNTGAQSGDVVLNYANLNTGDGNAEGQTATAGVRRSDADPPLLASYDGSTGLVGTGRAVRIHAA
jgi:methionine-rich copper-binding protein CopC